MRISGVYLPTLIAIFVISALNAQAQDRVIRGTVNVVLANSNGMVVLTDSKQTVHEAGGRIRSQNAQKLIRLDDRSVCAIAGFGGAEVSAGPQFNVDVMGILSDFRDQLASKKNHLSFEQELRALSFIIQNHIEVYANIGEVIQPGMLTRNELSFSLFLVGYDSDRKPKIALLELSAIPDVRSAGRIRWQFRESTTVDPVVDTLQYALGGMWDVGAKIMRNPKAYAQSPAIRKLLESGADKGATLRVTDLEAVGEFIATETSKQYPDFVGGPHQIAVLQNGKIAHFEQPSFPAPPKSTAFLLIMDVPVPLRFGPAGAIMTPSGVRQVWIGNAIVGYDGLPLDGNFFLGNEIRDSVVTYDGGPTVFDPSNRVINSSLQLGEHFSSNPDTVRALVQRFPWLQCLPFRCGVNSTFP